MVNQLTEDRYGIVTQDDGTIDTLLNPKNEGFKSLDAGLFWCADTQDGTYQLRAEKFVKYSTMTPAPLEGLRTKVLQQENY